MAFQVTERAEGRVVCGAPRKYPRYEASLMDIGCPSRDHQLPAGAEAGQASQQAEWTEAQVPARRERSAG